MDRQKEKTEMNHNEWIKTDGIQVDNIPSQLKERRQWVCWLLTLRDGKYSKIPINAATGTAASVVNPDSWTDFDTAFAKAPSFNGIGYVLTEDDGLVMIDLDHCRNPDTGAVDEWALRIVERIASYTEVSPSNRGLRILIRAKLPGARNRTARLPWEHGKDAGIEFYESGRYTTLTGNLLHQDRSQIEERQDQLESLHNEVFPLVMTTPVLSTPGLSDDRIIELCSEGADSEEFIRLFQGSTAGFKSPSDVDFALCRILARHTREPDQIDALFKKSRQYRDKWDEPRGNGTYGSITIAKVLRSNGEQGTLIFTRASDLKNQCDPDTEYVLENVLPIGGSSLLVAKPKIGKSTFALCLAVAVASGESFLGLATKKRPVLYLGLAGEAKKSELLQFIQVRNAENEEIFIYADATVPHLSEQLEAVVKRFPVPPLVIIDTLGQAISVRDFNNYAEVTEKLKPYTTLARQTNAHVMMLHHASKSLVPDSGDTVLGSTAIRAAVDSVLFLDKKEEFRRIKSEQRYGEGLPETLLKYDHNTRVLTCIGGAKEYEAADIERQIISRLQASDEGLTQEQIFDGLGGRTQPIRSVLSSMRDRGKVKREGTGTKGDPYRYSLIQSRLDPSDDEPR